MIARCPGIPLLCFKLTTIGQTTLEIYVICQFHGVRPNKDTVLQV